jgi:hypothetical protein
MQEFEQFIQSSRLQSIAKSSWDNNLVAPTKHLQQGVLFDPTQSAFAPLANALVAAFEKPTLSLEETTNLKQVHKLYLYEYKYNS